MRCVLLGLLLVLCASAQSNQAEGLYLARQYRTAHNGVTHTLYKQQFLGAEVHGAAWVINTLPDGTVLNSGGALYRGPEAGVVPPDPSGSFRAVRAAVAALNPRAATRFSPYAVSGAKAPNAVRFAGGPMAQDVEGETVWMPVNGKLRPAWRFRLTGEDGADYEAVVDAESNLVVSRLPLTLYQSLQSPRGLVFEGSGPQPNPTPGVILTAPPPIVERTLVPLTGDPVASPRGWVEGNQTSGNNTTTGENLSGTSFGPARTATAANGDFSFPLELGPGKPSPLEFSDAVITNLFYWINRSHDLFYLDGFDEAAGAYQKSNFGRGGVEGDATLAYVHYGAAANSAGLFNNSSFSSRSTDDGGVGSVRMYMGTVAPGFYTDGALDTAVIVHEYTHGVSTRIVRNLNSSYQGASMGEAWSDFFGFEYTLPAGAPIDGAYPSAEYLFYSFGSGIRSHPTSTDFDVNPLTYSQLGNVTRFLDVHADGEIWLEALWELRANLIRQYGETEGRKRARRLVIDGMKLTLPSPTMVDARDGILLADRADYNGADTELIWQAMAKRGLGVLALSPNIDTLHVLPSFEVPGKRPAFRFFDNPVVTGETATAVLYDAALTAPLISVNVTTAGGDQESLRMRRSAGGLYTGTITTSGAATVTQGNGRLELIPGDTITAIHTSASEAVAATAGVRLTYSTSTVKSEFKFSGETALLAPFAGVYGNYVNVKLPFEFPYNGRTYSAVKVNTGGALEFELTPNYPCGDRATLGNVAAIAPLFGEWYIGGVAQASENIYRSQQTPDSMTFRWAGETLADPAATVNFAATLFADGRIQFHYGPGNQNLGNIASQIGCDSPGPVTGISPGHGAFAQTISIRDYNNADSIIWKPPFNGATKPTVKLESPAADDRAQNTIVVRGIAYDDAETITRIDILIDGALRGRTTATVSRTDICGSQTLPGCPRIGYSSTLAPATLGLAAGPHTVQVLATNSRGATAATAVVPFTLDAPSTRTATIVFERPAAGTPVSGTVTVSGYAYDPKLRIVGLDLLVDGFTAGSPTYGLSRADVCKDSTVAPNCPLAGFQYALNTLTGALNIPNGDHRLQIRVRDEAGRSTLLPEDPFIVTVNNTAPSPVVVLQAPVFNQTLGGVTRAFGYAYVPGGRITSVTATVDRVSIPGVVTAINEARPEVCASLPEVSSCPNIGFRFDFDTKVLENGPHTFQITVTTDRGVRVTVPEGIASGIPFLVQN